MIASNSPIGTTEAVAPYPSLFCEPVVISFRGWFCSNSGVTHRFPNALLLLLFDCFVEAMVVVVVMVQKQPGGKANKIIWENLVPTTTATLYFTLLLPSQKSMSTAAAPGRRILERKT